MRRDKNAVSAALQPEAWSVASDHGDGPAEDRDRHPQSFHPQPPSHSGRRQPPVPSAWMVPAARRAKPTGRVLREARMLARRGQPGIPLEAYSADDLVREAGRWKSCAPFCTVSCVHQVAMLDKIRERPKETLAALFDEQRTRDPEFRVPTHIRLLSWMFVEPRRADLRAGLTRRMFGRKQGRSS